METSYDSLSLLNLWILGLDGTIVPGQSCRVLVIHDVVIGSQYSVVPKYRLPKDMPLEGKSSAKTCGFCTEVL
jgi:hypothetical protein